MYALLKAILLSIAPISELRGGIPLAIGLGINPWTAFFVCVIANILIIPIIFLFLDYLHKYFYKIKIYRICFDKVVGRARRKFQKHAGTKWEYPILFLFVAIPLPITGAYTGVLIAWLFGLKRRKSILSISLAIITAGIIISLLSLGIFSFFRSF